MPAFDIESFKANFRDGARQHLFYYYPTLPPIGISDEGLGLERMSYLVKATVLPNSTLEEVLVQWQGFDFPMGSKHTFGEFNMTFNVDREAKVRRLFENWVNAIHNPVTNEYGLAENYMANQRLQLLGYGGEVVLEYTLYHAWPKTVADITLDHGTTEIATFDVTWRYVYHTMSSTGTGA